VFVGLSGSPYSSLLHLGRVEKSIDWTNDYAGWLQAKASIKVELWYSQFHGTPGIPEMNKDGGIMGRSSERLVAGWIFKLEKHRNG
jgi:hypothetical protein